MFRDYMVKNSKATNMLMSEYTVLNKQRPTSFWKRDLHIPQWLLSLLVSLAVILFTAFAVFASIVTSKKETNDGACKENADCRRDLGLLCNNYRCGCAYSHFWSDSYKICERRRMINRTCGNDSMCDTLANLECHGVSLRWGCQAVEENATIFSLHCSSGSTELQCQCKAGMTWDGTGVSVWVVVSDVLDYTYSAVF